MSANDRQVGGDHYNKIPGEQHWDRAWRLKMDYWQSAITKYVERCWDKNGLEDLQKAAHYLQKYIELNGGEKEEVAKPSGNGYAMFTFQELQQAVKAADQTRGYDFPEDVQKFNQMYALPMPAIPTMHEKPAERLAQFFEIIKKEVKEVEDILKKVNEKASDVEVLTDVADWLGDIQVYCASEMLRWGIPWAPTLQCIMAAQWTKLGADGKPMVVEGKVQKGPNYVAPEPEIMKMLESCSPIAKPEGVDLTIAETRKFVPTAHAAKGWVEAHEDEMWQCEGYYGDGTQLYRHRKSRLLIRCKDRMKAYEWWGAYQDRKPPPADVQVINSMS